MFDCWVSCSIYLGFLSFYFKVLLPKNASFAFLFFSLPLKFEAWGGTRRRGERVLHCEDGNSRPDSITYEYVSLGKREVIDLREPAVNDTAIATPPSSAKTLTLKYIFLILKDGVSCYCETHEESSIIPKWIIKIKKKYSIAKSELDSVDGAFLPLGKMFCSQIHITYFIMLHLQNFLNWETLWFSPSRWQWI